MKTLLKFALAALGVLFALTVALAIAVAVLFDPKDYQPLLEESVSKATGRTLTLEGDLGLDFFPCCSITLGRAALGNPPGFPEGNFASVESAALSLKVWPLIARREVEIGTVRLDGLAADLLVRKDGAANWEFDSGAASAGEAAAEASVVPERLAVEGIEIRTGRIAYRDEQDGSDYLAQDLNLDTGDVTPGEPFDLALSTKVTDKADGTNGTVTLSATATLAANLEQLDLAKPVIDVTATGAAIPAKSLTARLTPAALAVEFRQDTHLKFSALDGEFKLPGLDAVAGDADGRFSAGDTSLAFGPSTELVVPQLALEARVTGKDIPGEAIDAKITTGKVSVDVDKLWGSVEALSADLRGLGAQLVVSGRGRIAERGADLTGTFVLDPVSPRGVLAVLKEDAPQTADPEALTRLGGGGQWALGPDSLKLSALDIKLDQTRLTGTLGFTDFDKPVTSFDLALDAIDLDRYSAPESAGSGSGTGGATTEAEDIPVETLRDLRLDGRLRIAQLVYAKAKLTNVSVGVRASDGRLRLDPVTAQVYGGEYRGSIGIDATGPVAKLTTEQELSALQVGSVLKDLYQNDKLTGALSGRISATGTGNGSNALLRSLDGTLSLDLADGAYLGTDLWHEIRRARALIRREAPPPAAASPRTKFNALQVAGRMSDGVLRTDKLLAEIPFTRMTGEGALNLVEKTLDFRLQGQVFEAPTFEDGSNLKDLTGLTIPVTLTGAMDKPKVSVDLKGLAVGAATQKLKDQLLKKLGGDEEAPAEPGTEQAAPADQPAEEPPKEEKPRDMLKRSLRDLLKNQ